MVVWKNIKVKTFDNQEVEVELHFIGGRQRDLLVGEYLQTKLDASDNKKNASVMYRPYDLKAKVMETYVKGVSVDIIDIDDYENIWEKYYKKSFKSMFGEEDSDLKNLGQTSERVLEVNTENPQN